MLMAALPDNPLRVNKMDEALEEAFGNIPVIKDADLKLLDRVTWSSLDNHWSRGREGAASKKMTQMAFGFRTIVAWILDASSTTRAMLVFLLFKISLLKCKRPKDSWLKKAKKNT